MAQELTQTDKWRIRSHFYYLPPHVITVLIELCESGFEYVGTYHDCEEVADRFEGFAFFIAGGEDVGLYLRWSSLLDKPYLFVVWQNTCECWAVPIAEFCPTIGFMIQANRCSNTPDSQDWKIYADLAFPEIEQKISSAIWQHRYCSPGQLSLLEVA